MKSKEFIKLLLAGNAPANLTIDDTLELEPLDVRSSSL
jgi:hypothetical protein